MCGRLSIPVGLRKACQPKLSRTLLGQALTSTSRFSENPSTVEQMGYQDVTSLSKAHNSLS